MKILTDEYKGHSYEYRFLEVAQQCHIFKNGEHLYTAYFKDSRWWCDCPGGTYHNKCHHEAKCTLSIQQPRLLEPWTLWAEEAGVMALTSSGFVK